MKLITAISIQIEQVQYTFEFTGCVKLDAKKK